MYVDAFLDRAHERVQIVERKNGERCFNSYQAEYKFYFDDQQGKFRSIFGTPVSRFSSRSFKEFGKELKIHSGKTFYENDISPIARCLETNYKNIDPPTLNVVFFDIEVGFDQEKGYSKPDDPFNPIISITLYLSWLGKLVTLAIPPKECTNEVKEKIIKDFPNTYFFDTEEELLETFLNLIDDADVLSGWNSEGYDIPYTVLRVTRVLGKEATRKFCLWNQYPRKRTFERFGAESLTFELTGRVHMDYMQLYRKYTYEERHSYSLDAILEYEGFDGKTKYEGTLDQLYHLDFYTFIAYNRQDVKGLVDIDGKLKYLDLANQIAHENTVLLPQVMSVVAVTEQAIINEAHERGVVVPGKNRTLQTEDIKAAGAYVAYPKKGMHDWVGSIDINSLYPSTIRALNMGPETIIAQLKPTYTDELIQRRIDSGMSFAAAWEGLFASLEYTSVMNKERGTILTVEWANGEETQLSAAEVWVMIFDSNQPWMLSANGTIFTYEIEGVVPGLLKRWYSERKELQAKLKEAKTPEEEEYWDKRQLVKKINLNSLYGAILNPHCRFFDKRIGQSTTLTGRSIAQHMDAYVNECITGVYDHVGDAIIYGDTDSCYFSVWPAIKDEVEKGNITWSKETCINLYNSIADQVNESFPGFMEKAFHCPTAMGSVIKGGREIVAIKGLFITKKRYALLYIDKDNRRYDSDTVSGKIKALGLDLKRSDTPKVIQEFLSDILKDVLNGASRDDIIKKIQAFKGVFEKLPAWEKGSPKRVNNLTSYGKKEQQQGKANMPGHVRASLNWNTLRKANSDNRSMQIIDGMKVIICKLKSNPLGWSSIAYPVDELHLPKWFLELPFDDTAMETTVIDGKVDNLLGVLSWDLDAATDTKTTFQSLFTFE